MPFIDIAFAAEVSRFEDPEFEEHARRNCNEDSRTRQRAIEELRNMVYERGECHPRRMDDAYLLRFLRCRRFIPALAHKLMIRYEEFRSKNSYLYDCSAFGLQKVKHVYGGTLPESPVNGRITLMRFGKWDTEAVPIVDVVRCALIMDEIAVMQPKLQILGVTIIVDLEGLSVRHVRQLTPTIAGQIVSLMGVNFPLLMHGLHIINYNWILHTFFYVFKQFIPSAAWSRMHFHGYDMSSLHKHIDPTALPPEYGGTCRHVISTEEWLRKVNMYKDDFMVQELRALGFTVED
ncbi:PREDICTED: alpha-tocopherol transfer protein-like isoform X1 [Papilio xuthus]|uniref:Alpha-tocopherol transfer protein-like isoform X1 n=2 Tax=Papilio xuthus TaxID=66420 RepID=A0A194PVS2_PAPXU|nr:PREDICTED: alpha-tocopherol transfer protein-like isoform X1 [Papilio xuthus]KPI97093.1 Clavesin-2 [Papilio xuthus]